MKHDLRCLLCKMQIHCRRGDLAAVRNHLRTEHDMVKYEVELVLHLCLISNEEHDSLIKTLSFRLDKFVEEGTFDKDINLFESKTKEEKLEPGDGMKAMETLDETAYRSLPVARLAYTARRHSAPGDRTFESNNPRSLRCLQKH